MPRQLSSVVTEGQVLTRPRSKVLDKFPELSSWLSDGNYPDGKPVGLVQFSIRPKGAVFVLQLRLQDQGGMVMTVEDASLDDALLLLEAGLTANPPPFTRDPYPLGTVSGKKK